MSAAKCLSPDRLNSVVFSVFAAVALAIAVIGVAGVMVRDLNGIAKLGSGDYLHDELAGVKSLIQQGERQSDAPFHFSYSRGGRPG